MKIRDENLILNICPRAKYRVSHSLPNPAFL